jgi:hypothetical protein
VAVINLYLKCANLVCCALYIAIDGVIDNGSNGKTPVIGIAGTISAFTEI